MNIREKITGQALRWLRFVTPVKSTAINRTPITSTEIDRTTTQGESNNNTDAINKNPINTNAINTNAINKNHINSIATHNIAAMSNTRQTHAFSLPSLPKGVIPEADVLAAEQLAQSHPSQHQASTQQLAMDALAMDQGGMIGYANSAGISMNFPGYPTLSELSQRSEYRAPVQTLATEMTRKWIAFKNIGDEDLASEIKQIERAFDTFKVRDAFKAATEHDGFFGRGMLFIDIDAQQEHNLPLVIDPATIKPGSLKQIKAIEPIWTSPIQYNSIDPTDRYFYRPNVWYVMGKPVHSTRLLNLISHPVADMLKPSYNFSGLSMTQMMMPYVNNWLRIRDAVSDLTHSFSTSGLKTDLSSILSGGTDTSTVLNRAQIFNTMRDNRGLMMLDKSTEEEFFQFNTPLSGLDKLQAQAQEHMAAPCHIPLVKLFGVTPSGLNASSEGEIKVYYDYVASQQQTLYTDPLVTILHIIQLHLFGRIYHDISFEFVPLAQMSEEQLAAINKTKADTGAALIKTGVLSKQEERSRLAEDAFSGYNSLDADFLPEQQQQGEGLAELGRPAMDGVWNEDDHPRDKIGRFADKGKGVAAKAETKPTVSNSMRAILGGNSGVNSVAFGIPRVNGFEKALKTEVSTQKTVIPNKQATTQKTATSTHKQNQEKTVPVQTQNVKIQKHSGSSNNKTANTGLKLNGEISQQLLKVAKPNSIVNKLAQTHAKTSSQPGLHLEISKKAEFNAGREFKGLLTYNSPMMANAARSVQIFMDNRVADITDVRDNGTSGTMVVGAAVSRPFLRMLQGGVNGIAGLYELKYDPQTRSEFVTSTKTFFEAPVDNTVNSVSNYWNNTRWNEKLEDGFVLGYGGAVGGGVGRAAIKYNPDSTLIRAEQAAYKKQKIENNFNAENPSFGEVAVRDFQPGVTHRAENINAGQVTDRDGWQRVDKSKEKSDDIIAQNLGFKDRYELQRWQTQRPAWKNGTTVIDYVLTQPRKFTMVINEKQYDNIKNAGKSGKNPSSNLGGWATDTPIYSMADVRNKLAVPQEWKPGKLYTVEFTAKPDTQIREGTVGDMWSTETMERLPGGGHQVEFKTHPASNSELFEIISDPKEIRK